MQLRKLGKTGLEVSRLCFGTLVMGPLQRNLTPEAGGELLAEAYKCGVNFIDTAELYNNYAHIRHSIKISGERPVIATKSYAFSADGAKKSVEKALREMEVQYLDIFLLHEQESEHTLRGHREALEALLSMKQEGLLRSVGISTHHISGVTAATALDDIEVIHPIVNRSGLGICDGTATEMLAAIDAAHSAGKGIYGMKVFGGGNLLGAYADCLNFALSIPALDSIAIGMQHVDELYANILAFKEHESGYELYMQKAGTEGWDKALHIDDWCNGCGSCARRCPQKALAVEGGKAVPLVGKCLLCGYCAPVCPVFAIKVF